MVSYIDERSWGATHRKWMRREWDTQTVHAVEIRSGTRCASCANDRGKIKGRKGGGPLDEAGVRAVVLTKEDKRKGKGGAGMGNDGAG